MIELTAEVGCTGPRMSRLDMSAVARWINRLVWTVRCRTLGSGLSARGCGLGLCCPGPGTSKLIATLAA